MNLLMYYLSISTGRDAKIIAERRKVIHARLIKLVLAYDSYIYTLEEEIKVGSNLMNIQHIQPCINSYNYDRWIFERKKNSWKAVLIPIEIQKAESIDTSPS